MRVLFVIPPYRTTDSLGGVGRLFPMPYAAVLLGTVLQECGHEVEIQDFLVPRQNHPCPSPASFAGKFAPAYRHWGWPISDCTKWLDDNLGRFDAVGLCSGQCNVWPGGKALAQHIRKLGKPLVVGGPGATTLPAETLRWMTPNVLVRGEGELVVEEAFERALKGAEGKVLDADAVEDLSELPVPDWGLAPPTNYPQVGGRVRSVLAVSRGCPWRCTYCSVHTIFGRTHRRQTRKRIVDELLNLHRHGVQYFTFLDDNLFISRKATTDILKAIEVAKSTVGSKAARRWVFYAEEGIEVRIAAIPGLLASIAGAGFEQIVIGVETFSAERAKEIGKPYKQKHLKAAIRECTKITGTVPRLFYIIGLPGDTVQSVAGALVKFGRLGLAARPNNLKILPGTQMEEEYRRRGWLLDVLDEYDWRLSSWWTPTSTGMEYRQMRALKVVLGALSSMAEQYGIRLFADSLPTIVDQFSARGLQLKLEPPQRLSLTGGIWRPTPYRYALELLLLREGAVGARSDVVEADGDDKHKTVNAWATKKPKDEIQAALVEALQSERPKTRRRR